MVAEAARSSISGFLLLSVKCFDFISKISDFYRSFLEKIVSYKSFFNPMGRILMELSVDDALLLGTRFLGGELLFSFTKLVVCHIFLNICLLQLMAAEARLM